MNPFDLTGPEFLSLYFLLLILAAVLAWFVRQWLRLPSSAPAEKPALSPFQAAYLAEGPWRAFAVAFSRLLNLGLLREQEGGKFVREKELFSRASPLERKIWESAAEPASIPELYGHASNPLEDIRKQLQRLGLLMDAGTSSLVNWIPAFMLLLIAVFGGVKVGIGISRSRPVVYLVLGVVGAFVLACVYAFSYLRRSRRGEDVLAALRKEHAALEATARSNPQALLPRDAPMALALFGVVALSGAAHASLMAHLPAAQATSSSWWGPSYWHCSSCGTSYTSSCSSSCGGGGCGGGGCGGCGGGN